MGKPTISKAIFNRELLNYQRVPFLYLNYYYYLFSLVWWRLTTESRHRRGPCQTWTCHWVRHLPRWFSHLDIQPTSGGSEAQGLAAAVGATAESEGCLLASSLGAAPVKQWSKSTTFGGAPKDVNCFLVFNPLWILVRYITNNNHSEIGVMFTNLAIDWGTTLHVITIKSANHY